MLGPALVHLGGVRRFGGLAQPPRWVKGCPASVSRWCGRARFGAGHEVPYMLWCMARNWRAQWADRESNPDVAGMGGSCINRSALPRLMFRGYSVVYSVMAVTIGQELP
jgi:hypothetical protein